MASSSNDAATAGEKCITLPPSLNCAPRSSSNITASDEKGISSTPSYLFIIKDNADDQEHPTIHTLLVSEAELRQVTSKSNRVQSLDALEYIKQRMCVKQQMQTGTTWNLNQNLDNRNRTWENQLACMLLNHKNVDLFKRQACTQDVEVDAAHMICLFTHEVEYSDDSQWHMDSIETSKFSLYFEIHSSRNCGMSTTLVLSDFEIEELLETCARQAKKRKFGNKISALEALSSENIRDEWTVKARRLAGQPILINTNLANTLADALVSDEYLEHRTMRATSPTAICSDANMVMIQKMGW